MNREDVKTREDFECLMKERAEAYKKKLGKRFNYTKVSGVGAIILCDADGNADGEASKKLMCEFNRLALSTEGAWVECGDIREDSFGFSLGYVRVIMLYIPGDPKAKSTVEKLKDAIFILHMNVKGVKPERPMGYGPLKEPRAHGSFCTVEGGC